MNYMRVTPVLYAVCLREYRFDCYAYSQTTLKTRIRSQISAVNMFYNSSRPFAHVTHKRMRALFSRASFFIIGILKKC